MFADFSFRFQYIFSFDCDKYYILWFQIRYFYESFLLIDQWQSLVFLVSLETKSYISSK